MVNWSTANGQIPASQLTVVQSGMRLRKDSAIVFKAIQAEGIADGYSNFGIAYDAGAYRNLWLQGDMIKNPQNHNISRASAINLASPGLSTHGWGDRFDLVGAPINYIVNLAGKYGCIREFGAADPNHFKDLHTWQAPTVIPQTAAATTGDPGEMPSNCWRRMQLLAQRGAYTGPVNGILQDASWTGVQTALTLAHLYTGTIDGEPKQLSFTALQVWGGVIKPVITDDWHNISPAAWRKIAKRLNTL